MQEKDVNPTQLMRGANISYTMAHRFSKGEKPTTSINFEVLDRICEFLQLDDINEILEYERDEE